MDPLLPIMIYIVLATLLVLIAKCCSERNKIIALGKSGRKTFNLPICVCILWALAFAMLNMLCTKNDGMYSGDRLNYMYDYLGYRSSTVGLDFVFLIYRYLGFGFEQMLYATTFVTCLVTLLSFRVFRGATPRSLALLLATNFVFFTFVGLKQCYANAIASVFFARLSQEHKNKLPLVLLAISAALFHSTGYILFVFILYGWMTGWRWGVERYPILLTLLIVVLFQPLGSLLGSLLAESIPSLSTTLNNYLSEESGYGDTMRFELLIKSAPFVIVLLMSRTRDQSDAPVGLRSMVIATIFGVSFSVLSVATYWMSRFGAIFYLPIAVVFGDKSSRMDARLALLLDMIVIGMEGFFTLRSVYLVFALYGGY